MGVAWGAPNVRVFGRGARLTQPGGVPGLPAGSSTAPIGEQGLLWQSLLSASLLSGCTLTAGTPVSAPWSINVTLA